MKRDTCKTLIIVGIIWLIFISLLTFMRVLSVLIQSGIAMDSSLIVAILMVILIFASPSWVLFIIAGIRWNSEKNIKDSYINN